MGKVSEFYSSPGFCDEKMYLFYCDTLTKLTDKRSLDEDEFLTADWYSLDELKNLLSEGKIVDAKTIYAITVWETCCCVMLKARIKNNDRETF